MAFPRPLAIGLVQAVPHATRRERTQARIELALDANDRGYALIETLELGFGPVADEIALQALDELLREHDVQLLVLHGDVDGDAVRALADAGRVLVRRMRVPALGG